ncbi:MAG: family 78 glycoside hydrolase catalytic domain [Saprospiraceae bacterium]|nr:family 78 glycoside hydrolase catalytic domain [Saprospiraceae bacterium]
MAHIVAFAAMTLEKLQTDYQTNPIGMDVTQPQFSWQMKATDNRRGYVQTAYQIVVTNAKKQVVWDSKRTNGDVSHGITYAGTPLNATTRYTWKLTVWNNFNEMATRTAWFETGLMNPSVSAWDNAQWIGGGDADLVLYSPALSVFKALYTLQLDKNSGSTRAAFVLGANDPRLMNKNMNLKGLENAHNQSYVAFELDISGVSEAADGLARCHIFRVGYTPTDSPDKPFASLDIPHSIIDAANKYDKHSFNIESVFGTVEVFVDGKKLIEKNPEPAGFGRGGLNINPVGRGGDFISFPMLADIGFQTAANQVAYFSDVAIKHFRSPSNTLFAENLNDKSYTGIFKNDKLTIENKAYKIAEKALITANPSRNAAPMLRHTFSAQAKPIAQARLYVTARGIYEMYINGKRIGDDYFNPGSTQYNLHHMYQTYDVTPSVKAGKNAIGAWLGEGWWSGNVTYTGSNWNMFGDRQSLLCKLVIAYQDGTTQTIISNPAEWKLFTEGPIRNGSFFQGEVYDANRESAINGWTTTNYDDKNWKAASAVPLEGTTAAVTVTKETGYKSCQLIGQMGENARLVKTLTAQSVEEARPKVFVYDMGQNMVGVPKIVIKNGTKGQQITLRFAEVKYPNLPEYKGQEGMVMMENIRAALAHDVYILRGGDEVIQPRFTFHGYRFLEITGIEKALPIQDVMGLVISSVAELSSEYKTSNDLVNKLWQNITWSLRSNFLSIPTDCPQRNERLGWSGDISVFSRSATYLTDANMFLRRHLLGMRDVQAESGRFTDVAPLGGGFGGTLWGSAGIVVAWETYQQYGDKALLSEHYEAMKRYIQFLETKIDKNTGILTEGPLGDWLSPEGNKNDNTLFWMAYFAYDLDIMSQMGTALGKNDDATTYKSRSASIKKVFNEVYVDKATHRTVKSGLKTGFIGAPNETDKRTNTEKGKLMDTQASYAIPLALGTFDADNKPFASQHLNETIQRRSKDDSGVERPEYSLMTGFIGTASIMEALSESGNTTTAYRLLQQKTYPSWLYSVVNGATSIWERLNSYTVENGFGGNNSMNSFNHYSFGSVAAWMYNYSLGIQRSPDKVGFKHIVLRPTPDPDNRMTWASGYYRSIYGTISSEWKNTEGGKWTYKTTIPANTTATVYLSTTSLSNIKESGTVLSQAKGIRQARFENGKAVMTLSSGTYVFEIK